MTTVHEPKPIQYDPLENDHARMRREQQYNTEKAAYGRAQEQMEADRIEASQQAADDAQAAKAAAIEVAYGQAMDNAAIEAVTKMLTTTGNNLEAATRQAKDALEVGMAADSVGLEGLFQLWTDYRRASAVVVGTVGHGRQYVNNMRGNGGFKAPTDALESVSFATIIDQAVAARVRADRDAAALVPGQLAAKARSGAEKNWKSS
jgi:hypothetical protein